MEWIEIKVWLEESTHLDRDALHIYCALAIQFGLAIFFRKGIASPWPWLAVLIAALGNEYIDLQGVSNNPEKVEYYRSESYHDLWNTMLLPTILIFIANFWPKLLVGRKSESVVVEDSDQPEQSS